MSNQGILKVLLLVPTFLFSLSFHEYAHAWTAFRRGDRTAYSMGRLSLHPMAHVDILGTLLLPIICIYNGWPFIGWAKPVPIDYRNLKNGKWDAALVAAAGPISNVLLALFATLFVAGLNRLQFHHSVLETTTLFAVISIQINLMLALFNLIPVPPLDGFMMIQAVLPRRVLQMFAVFSTPLKLILILLFLGGGFRYLMIPAIYCFNYLVGWAGIS